MEPLASQIRPQKLEEFIGQTHLVGPQKPLRVAIEKRELFSFILWGPPGCGKTTLARIYATALNADFHELSAVDSGKDDIKKVVQHSKQAQNLEFGTKNLELGNQAPSSKSQVQTKPLVLFIDEIHRFNKAQQDFLLPFVERGDITLIGATTENPSFEIISPLLSRCRVFVLEPLNDTDLTRILRGTKIPVPKAAMEWLVRMADGDARMAITVLDATKKLYDKVTINTLKEAIQSKHLRYDKKGEEHYNTISAFIKSMRASQPDAALYYLARMVDAGEDPLFIARRMVIFASEDIGLAVPTALVVANATFEACEKIGYPECAINLAHGVAYLSTCKKSRASYDAYYEALADVQKEGNLPIPMNIRNAPTKLMKELGYHKGYKLYDKESYLPEKLRKKKYLKDK